MPEIKHQFTGGKMNKDLDERLVPNGQYRDALNIQVSTSDDSNVGVVQNILGNSLVPGQNFIGENSVCVGSIADEKNDKLYYFITQKELLENGGFDNKGDEWNVFHAGNSANTEPAWRFNGNVARGGQNDNYGYMEALAPGIVEGKIYRLTYDIIEPGDYGHLLLANHTTVASTLNSGSNDNVFVQKPDIVGTHSTDWLQGASNTGIISLWNWKDYVGVIDNVSAREVAPDYILEYDSKTKKVTPVFVDVNLDVLKFNPNKTITGINIIDDLLFWTDNESEPKKINIKESIRGTSSNGTSHTKLINESQNIELINNVDIQESHITVIKSAPYQPLGLDFTSEGDAFNEAGIIVSTSAFGSNVNNSSFIFHETNQDHNIYDWSNVGVGDEIKIKIPESWDGVNTSNVFTLDWKVGDKLLFKEYSPAGPPSTPIIDSTVRATIQPWSGNVFQDSLGNLMKNGTFNLGIDNWTTPQTVSGIFIPETTNYEPHGWMWNGLQQALFFRVTPYVGGWAKVWQSPVNHSFAVGEVYTLKFNLEALAPNVNQNAQPLYGRIRPRIVVAGTAYDFPWTPLPSNIVTGAYGYPATPMYYEETITIDSTSETIGGQQNYNNTFAFVTDGNNYCRGAIDNVELLWDTAPGAQVKIKIDTIDPNAPTPTNQGVPTLNYLVEKELQTPTLFKDKFVRFSYRYKYKDGEYSSFAPFSETAFNPGTFDYHPSKGYNIGMVNRVSNISLKAFSANTPLDVDGIDLLAKIEGEPFVYIIDTVRANDIIPLSQSNNAWGLDKYTIESDTVKGAVPGNQLLRPWDNVPKKALAQEVVGNRMVYGNYVQGYDLITNLGNNFVPDFHVRLDSISPTIYNKKSIKSLRDYQIGVVFADEHGRETPVLSNQSGAFNIKKDKANKNNIFNVGILLDEYPVNMKYFKFFIKETSGEYYNIAMDRNYVDDDGNAWVSFPTNEVNKIDLDTVLILKKGINSSELVEEEAIYKVLDIKNEAPDFIKTDKKLIEERLHSTNSESTDIFGDALVDVPLEDRDTFKMKYKPFANNSGDNLHKIIDGEIYVEFKISGSNKTSKRYKVSNISCDIDLEGMSINEANYTVKLDEVFKSDINFITDDFTGVAPSRILDDSVTVRFYNYVVNETAAFAGRFFVKILADQVFNTAVTTRQIETEIDYRVIDSKTLYFMRSDHTTLEFKDNSQTHLAGHRSGATGLTSGAYDTERTGTPGRDYINDRLDPNGRWVAGPWATIGHTHLAKLAKTFSCFATFFRRYAWSPSSTMVNDDSGTSVGIGHYKFGRSNETEWKEEFLNYTSSGDADFEDGWDTSNIPATDNSGLGYSAGGNVMAPPEPYIAADIIDRDDEVWFIDNGPYQSWRGSNDNMHWKYIGLGAGGVDAYTIAAQRSGIWQSNNHPGAWFMDISLGGIFDNSSGLSPTFDVVNDFFQIGNNGNPAYDDTETDAFVAKLNPGIQFRFKEDPSGTIYTAQPTTTRKNIVRYAGNYDYAHQVLTNHHEAPNLSPNFNKGWRLKVTPPITWNPAPGDTYGPIANGYEITVAAVASGTTTDGDINDKWIALSSNVGTDPVYGSVPITAGLIITSYNNGTALPGQYLLVKDIVQEGNLWKVYYTGYERLLSTAFQSGTLYSGTTDIITPTAGQDIVFQQPIMNGYSENSVVRLNTNHPSFSLTKTGIEAVGYTIEFVEALTPEPEMPTDPAIFETEPKEKTDLDVYYEASGLNPILIDDNTIHSILPIGSVVTGALDPESYFSATGSDMYIPAGTEIVEITSLNTIKLSNDIPVAYGDPNVHPPNYGPGVDVGRNLKIIRPNKTQVVVQIKNIIQDSAEIAANTTSEIEFESNLLNSSIYLNFSNCFSFGNGVESNRVKDSFNLPYVLNGVRVSTTLETEYKEEHRKYGLIFSGIYNSNSGVNNLNQFIQAEKITKDINPIYGSIQKLFSRNTDLITLCEDKCLKILANKDAIFNADGNPQLTANNNVLGQTMPFSGEFGISKNPESFASESYRVYFADKQRGAILRLSKDGLTPISMHGMSDWFKDNLKLSNKIIGGFDDNKNEYNVTLFDRNILSENLIINGDFETDYTEYYNTSHWFWDSTAKNVYSDSYNHAFIGQKIPITLGKKYKVSYTIRKPENTELEGRLWVTLHDDTGKYVNVKGTDFGNSHAGTYEYIVSTGVHAKTWPFSSGMESSINFHVKNHDSGPYFNGILDNISVIEILEEPTTVSFKEDVRGWVSFKSFIPENGVSAVNDYYTFKNGFLYKHYDENVERNNFYNISYNSSLNVIFNESVDVIKSFHTINYEGSQSKISSNTQDSNYYNLLDKDGWYVNSIITDQQEGSLNEFIKKENKWFNYIKGINSSEISKINFEAFNVQGIGLLLSHILIGSNKLTFNHNVNVSLQVGDTVYFQTPSTNGAFDVIETGDVKKIGIVSGLTNQTLYSEILFSSMENAPTVGDYILFVKNDIINTSSLIGYYADVKLENNSKDKIELFSVSSEITQSSN